MRDPQDDQFAHPQGKRGAVEHVVDHPRPSDKHCRRCRLMAVGRSTGAAIRLPPLPFSYFTLIALR
jgi:hypothetical protein